MNEPIDRPNAIQQLVRKFARSRYGSRIFSRLAPPVDHWTLRLSAGKVTATTWMAGYPVITLTTIGAKSGLPRKTILLATPYGDRLVLIASNFGNPSHPAWYHNLIAHPQVQVETHTIKRDYYAQVAQGNERQALWDLAVAYYPGYHAYRNWTRGREIPVVVLTPLVKP